ncbi:ATP-binding protein [Paenibacillus turpanensis]|uniref:ATP-binding protein n=1 Tax=Paenibacillus turpanensis TaxID=2689078 RepID=UPI00140B2711|nr:ATP-binding protein [Paenibacillus turpanensis]
MKHTMQDFDREYDEEGKEEYARSQGVEEWLHEVSILKNGRFLKVGQELTEVLDYRENELLGESYERLLSPQHRSSLPAGDLAAPFTGRIHTRVRALRKDQSEVFVDIHGKVKQMDGDQYVLIKSLEDVTNRRQDDTHSREMEERFHAAFHYAAVGMALVSVNGTIQKMNYAFCEALDIQEHDQPQSILNYIHPEDRDGYLEGCTGLLIGELQSCEMERRFIHSSRRLVWGYLCITLVRDADGRPLYYIIQMQDITQKKETEELLRKSDKLSAVGQLAAGVAHEVRNPLTVLKGFAQILQGSDPTNQYYGLMLSEVERIESIISEFLAFAKPQIVRFDDHDLWLLVEDVVNLMETKAVMNSVSLKVLRDAAVSRIQCDANQIKQVLINMLQNAIEAMPNGGNIYITLKQEEYSLLLQIQDEGCGIPEDRVEKLGEPFYSSKEKGTGLGLMISYQIIEKHQGKIQVESKVNEGTTFTITLPMAQALNRMEERIS